MSSIVIAEKSSQKALYERTVGGKYGKVLAARGHLLELAAPEAVNPKWAKWSDDLLVPPDGFYPFQVKDDPDIKQRLAAMTRAAKYAETIYLATDPDREGEGIAQNILKELAQAGFCGRVLRVLPLAEDAKSMELAFQNAKPIEEFAALYEAFQARSQSDHIFNLSLTRAASTLIGGGGSVISIGRVITPTLGIICQREHDIANFKPQDYFVPSITVEGHAGRMVLSAPSAHDARCFDRADAETMAAQAEGFRGAMRVAKKSKSETPPYLFSLSSLQVACGQRFKWSAKKTSDVLQSLYSKYQVTTYPRSGEVSIPEAEIENAEVMKQNLEAIFGQTEFEAVIRRKKGAFNDKDLQGASHFAIIPNINTVASWQSAYSKMSDDERKLFEQVSRRYLTMLGPDRLIDSTTMLIQAGEVVFKTTGAIERDPGWKAALEVVEPQRGQPKVRLLPAFSDGDQVTCIQTHVEVKQTTAPIRIAEAGIIDLMINAWKVIDDGQEREQLKDAKGIGADSTRGDVVANLRKRGFIKVENGKILATDAAMSLWKILSDIAPILIDVAHTARMEMSLHAIEKGEKTSLEVVEDIAGQAGTVIQSLRGISDRIDLSSSRPPTSKMLKFARQIAKQKDKTLPSEVTKSFAKCRDYINENAAPKSVGHPKGEAGNGAAPTDKQRSFAARIANAKKLEIPKVALQDRRALSQWIDSHK